VHRLLRALSYLLGVGTREAAHACMCACTLLYVGERIIMGMCPMYNGHMMHARVRILQGHMDTGTEGERTGMVIAVTEIDEGLVARFTRFRVTEIHKGLGFRFTRV